MTLVLSHPTRSDEIRKINDRCRVTFTGCSINVTAVFAKLDPHTKALALHRVRTFRDFDHSDQRDEHDSAFFDMDGQRFFFRFDYFAPSMQHGSNDPSDAENTRRILTVGLASEA